MKKGSGNGILIHTSPLSHCIKTYFDQRNVSLELNFFILLDFVMNPFAYEAALELSNAFKHNSVRK